MGHMRFVADNRELLTDDRLARAYIAGPDEAPTFGRTLLSGKQIVVERPDDASGAFTIPWPIPGHGDWLLASNSLMERERPYNLEVELARGLVFRLRDQLAAWEMLGLKTTKSLVKGVKDATRAFSRAEVSQGVDPASAAVHAGTALVFAADASCELVDLYSQQALAMRMANDQRLTTLLGVRLREKPPEGAIAKRVADTFNLTSVSCGWSSVEPSEGRREWTASDKPVEWARSKGMRVCLGPLLEFDDKALPDWAYLWEGDLETLTSLMIGHVRATVQRYRGKAQLWHVASKINRDKVLSLSDEQRLQIVANAVRTIRQLDPNTPVVVGVEQPWGEYRATRQTELSPLDFADALERADLGIAGFDLELNIGVHPHGTTLRSPLAFSRLIDLWNVRLESPLMLSISLPSSAEDDPHADPRLSIVAGGKDGELLTPDFQAKWVERHLPMMMAKNAVQVAVWSQLSDEGKHRLPHAGLYDPAKAEKPIVNALADIRKRLLV
ncbi:MAG: endo-1,4-beta-xylanase [Planctomycetota bacterium]